MSHSKRILIVLRLFADLLCLNIFVFNVKKHVFERSPIKHRLISVLHKLSILPLLLFVLVVIYLFKGVVDKFGNLNMMGKEALTQTITAGLYVFFLTKLTTTLELIRIYMFQWQPLERLLNSFVRIHEQYVALYELPPQQRWLTFYWTTIQIFTYQLLILPARINFFGLLLISLQSCLLMTFALLGLVLLHAFYCGVEHEEMHLLERQYITFAEISKILQFYRDLMILRESYAKFINRILGVFLLYSLFYLTYFLHVEIIRTENKHDPSKLILVLLNPLPLLLLTHDICSVQQMLGNNLLVFGHENMSQRSVKLLEEFCLQKLIVHRPPRSYSMFALLDLRKDFMLVFLDSVWSTSMLLSSMNYDVTKHEHSRAGV